jgi:hypothetical protein
MTQTVLTSDVRPPSWTAFRLVLVARDANEGDTRLLVTHLLCDGLGFDKYADLTTEYQVKGEFADYGSRIDRDLVAFIEVKRVASPASLWQVLVSDPVAEAIRKELWRQTGHRIDTPEIVRLLTETLLRPGGPQPQP